MAHRSELTIDDLLTDPVTLAVLRADGVEPAVFRRTLNAAAGRLAGRATPEPAGQPWLDHRTLIRDCLQYAARQRGEASPGTERTW